MINFSQICLKNWKNFTTCEVSPTEQTFLVGPNASGKSNFLDALKFLRDLVTPGGGLREAISRRGGAAALHSLAVNQPSDVEIKVAINNKDAFWQYELAFNQNGMITKEKISRDRRILLDRPNQEDKQDPVQLRQTHLEQVNVNKEFRDLASFFESIRYQHIVPQLIRDPDRSASRTNDPYGSDFLEMLASTPDRISKIQSVLREAIPYLKEISVWRDVCGIPHLRCKFDHWHPQGTWQTEEQLSDGMLRLTGMLWSAMDSNGPLLLEEPEMSLHPEVVRQLPKMLTDVQQQQVFISTHSPGLLINDEIGLDQVLLLTPTPNGTEVTRAADHQDICSLYEGGVPLAEAVIAKTQPAQAAQLALFADTNATQPRRRQSI